ncbi:MAG: hypothetical protein V3U37_04490, partial [Nitrospinaceae bacterium]
MKAEKYLESLSQIAAGDRLYAVGGSVRDRLLGKECTDHDFTAHGVVEIAEAFASKNKLSLVRLDETPGRETLRVVLQKQATFDFTEMQGRTIEEDLNRRDFTINAMAVPLKDYIEGNLRLIDPCKGKSDLENRIVRRVSTEVLSDDPLRMLRAFRFAADLNFEIESGTLTEIGLQKQKIENVAEERVLYELLLLLNSQPVFSYLELMDGCGLLESILPETGTLRTTDFEGNNAWEQSLRSVKELEHLLSGPDAILGKNTGLADQSLMDKRPLLRLAMILHLLDRTSTEEPPVPPGKTYGQPFTVAVLKRLRASNSDTAFIARTIKYQQEALETCLS